MRFNIAQECLGRQISQGYGKKTAMIFADENLNCVSYSYSELDALSSQFAADLVSRGLKPGGTILLRLGNVPAFPVCFFGAIKAGLIPVPSSSMLAFPEMCFLLQDSKAIAMVTEENLLKGFPHDWRNKAPDTIYMASPANVLDICFEQEILRHSSSFNIHLSDENDPAYMVYTSGTTGYPKGVVHAHRALRGRLPAGSQWFSYRENDIILHSGRFNWTYVLGTGMMDPLYKGKTVVIHEGSHSPEKWIQILKKFQCTVFIGVPTIFRQILQRTSYTQTDVPTLSHCMCAGEHLSDQVQEGWIQRFGIPIYEGLGMSECSYYISQSKEFPLRKNSAGKIQPGHRIEILDETLSKVAPNQEGMLCIHQSDPGLFLGYWNMNGKMDLPLSHEWFLTGDYAIADQDGYITFMGRRDEIIKSFGYRISPLEIERVFRDHPAVEDVAAFAYTAEKEKVLVGLALILKKEHTPAIHHLIEWASERMAVYKIPKKIFFLQSFPRSSNGKVLRQKIPELIPE